MQGLTLAAPDALKRAGEHDVSLLGGIMRLGTIGVIAVLLAGCSAVPGDAALRGGHPEQAAELYRRGAEQGDAAAALRLGLLVEQGRASGYGEAGTWYKRACDLGSLPGCHNVGVSYEYGKNGLTKDLAAAQDAYTKAASAGYMQSQYNLGSMYSNNYVTPPNDVEGLKWLLIAQKTAADCKQQQLCQWILQDPPGHRRQLESRLSTQQQSEAHELETKWNAKK